MATKTATAAKSKTKAKPATKAKAKAKTAAKPAAKTKAAAKTRPAAEAKTTTKAKAKTKAKTWRSRAVQRLVEPGSMVDCSHCGDRVKFQAKMRHEQVICNVYVKNVWDRVEHFHAPCYVEADQPFGPPVD
ncbi:MAG: hypothetical protein ACR2QE_07955 [Acidimicrobiales bacterium]